MQTELTPEVIIAAVTTLLIFTYLFGDNFLYRWVLALIVGSGTGYALAIAGIYLWEHWLLPGMEGRIPITIILPPLILGALLLLKGIPSISPLGNSAMGLLLGVGAAVAISGALLGTIIPQTLASGTPFAEFASTGNGLTLIEGLLVLIGTSTTLIAFSPRALKSGEKVYPVLLWLQRLGRAFVIVALAVAFAGALTSALTILIDRLWSLANFFAAIIGGLM